MYHIITEIDWAQIFSVIWSALLLPLTAYAGAQIRAWAKTKQLEQYTDILYQNAAGAVKDVYETIVKDMKGTTVWTKEKQNEVRELAKAKTVCALTNTAYRCLKAAHEDFDEYLDGMIGTVLYDLKQNTMNQTDTMPWKRSGN